MSALSWLRTWRIPILDWTPAGTLALLVTWAVGFLGFLPIAALGNWLIVYQQWPDLAVFVAMGLLFGVYWIGGAAWLEDALLRWMRARREGIAPAINHAPAPPAVTARRRRIRGL